MRTADYIRQLTPVSFLFIYFFAQPEDSMSSLFFKVFVFSVSSFIIFGYMSNYDLNKYSTLPKLPYVSAGIVSLIAVPIGLLIYGYSISFVLSVILDPVTIFFSVLIFIAILGFASWGIDFGKWFYRRKHPNPVIGKRKLRKKKAKELYPEYKGSKEK